MAQTEKTRVVNKIVAWLKTIPQCEVRKRHGSPYGTTGDADLYGCIRGRHFEIECKVWPNTPSAAQEIRLQNWQSAGAVVGIAYNIDDAKIILAPLL